MNVKHWNHYHLISASFGPTKKALRATPRPIVSKLKPAASTPETHCYSKNHQNCFSNQHKGEKQQKLWNEQKITALDLTQNVLWLSHVTGKYGLRG